MPVFSSNKVTQVLQMPQIKCPERMLAAGGLEPERKVKIGVCCITRGILPLWPGTGLL